MTRQIVSNSGQPVSVVTNLPFETTNLDTHQIAQVSGGYIWNVISDYISEEFGIDLPEPGVDVHPWSM